MFKKKLLIEVYTVLCRIEKKIAQVCTYYLADLNIGHCVHEGKLGRLIMLTF